MTELRNFFYFDIETIPVQSEAKRADVAAHVKPPANYKDPDKIAAWLAEAGEEAVGKTSFDGFQGHIAAIAWRIGGGETQVRSVRGVDDPAEEIAALSDFFAALPHLKATTLVGHNIIGFDIPFLTRRAVVLGVKMPAPWTWPRNPKPWSDKCDDTMLMAGGSSYVGLDAMCRHLGIPSKDGFDGSQVAAAWTAGLHDQIADYCKDDVQRVAAVHGRYLAAGWWG